MRVEKIVEDETKLRKFSNEVFNRQMRWYCEINPILNELENSFPYAVIKGQVLSKLAYGSPGYRNSHDIDLLVDKKYLMNLDKIMKKYEFEAMVITADGKSRKLTRREKIMYFNSHQTAPYCKWIEEFGEKIEIDINTSIFGEEMENEVVTTADLLSELVDIEIFDLKMKTLNHNIAFIQLCLHHYREMNAPYILKVCNPINTKMFQDIYLFFKVNIVSNIQEFLEISKKLEVTEYIYYMLKYTFDVFNDAELSIYQDLFKNQKGVLLLDCYGLSDSERKTWKFPFSYRLDNEKIFDLIVDDLSTSEKEKIDIIWSVLDENS